VLEDKVKQHKGFDDQASDYNMLLAKVEQLQQAIVKEADIEIARSIKIFLNS
jgi:putative ATP-dependent endonuclease of OLD family